MPAQRLQNLTESVIREMTRLAMQYEAINLSQGFPDFDPPPEVLHAARQALQTGHNQYTITWGNPQLRRKIAEKYEQWYGLGFHPETEVTVTCGVTEAITATVMALVDPGDKVIVLDPCHESYWPAVVFAGATPLWVSLSPPEYGLDEVALRAAFAQNPKAIIFNTPQNPTGRVFSSAELQLIADLCVAHGTIAIVDEIYEHIVYDDYQHVPIATLPSMAERTVTISGLTKTYAGTGWRVAWVVAPAPLAEAIRKMHDFMTICAPAPLQEAAIAALTLPESFYEQLRLDYTARRAKMLAILLERGFQAQLPQGAYYIMANYSALQPDMDDLTFTRWLIMEKKVAVVPGSSFYKNNPALGQGLVRFAFPKQLTTLEEAGRRL